MTLRKGLKNYKKGLDEVKWDFDDFLAKNVKMAAVPGHEKVDLAIALRSDATHHTTYICITEHPLTPTLHS